jgi:hypothetical protein
VDNERIILFLIFYYFLYIKDIILIFLFNTRIVNGFKSKKLLNLINYPLTKILHPPLDKEELGVPVVHPPSPPIPHKLYIEVKFYHVILFCKLYCPF